MARLFRRSVPFAIKDLQAVTLLCSGLGVLGTKILPREPNEPRRTSTWPRGITKGSLSLSLNWCESLNIENMIGRTKMAA